jgi:hypothetical protein
MSINVTLNSSCSAAGATSLHRYQFATPANSFETSLEILCIILNLGGADVKPVSELDDASSIRSHHQSPPDFLPVLLTLATVDVQVVADEVAIMPVMRF